MSELKDWQIQAIEKMTGEGQSQRTIAKSIGVSVPTVNKYVKSIRATIENRAKRRNQILPPEKRTPYEIDITNAPTDESIQKDILTLYRRSLKELEVRMPEMSTHEIYTLSMALLTQLNGPANEN